MGILGIFWIGKIYRLRRKYDRVRERADRISDRSKKLKVLQILDQVESTLVMLEEKNISRFERRRMIFNVKEGIEQAKRVIKDHEHIQAQSQMREPQQQRR